MELFDLHTHTRYSDGKNTVVDNIRMAEASGLAFLAITDHMKDIKETGWIEAMLYDIKSTDTGVRVLTGVEGTILDTQGTVSVSREIAGKLDVVLADMSSHTRGVLNNRFTDLETLKGAILRAYTNICKNDVVDIVAHPFNLGRHPVTRGIVYLDSFSEKDLKKVAGAFAENDKIFEIMNQMAWWFPDVPMDKFTRDYVKLVKIFAGEGVMFSMGSDAHSAGAVANLTWARKVIEAAGIESRLINPGVFLNRKRKI